MSDDLPRNGKHRSASAMTVEAKALRNLVADLLDNCQGAFPYWIAFVGKGPGWLSSKPPIVHGLLAGIIFAGVFCGAQLSFPTPDSRLLWLCAFGSLYFAIAVFLSQQTSQNLLSIIEHNILPQLTPPSVKRIEDGLKRRFRPFRVDLLSLSIAGLGTAAAAAAIHFDAATASTLQILLWVPEWFILFLTAARATDVCRFYDEFSLALGAGDEPLYPLSPATTPLVRDIASLGRTMLVFWLGISASITLIIPFLSMADRHQYGSILAAMTHEASQSRFVWLVVPTTIFFSGIFGTFVFLKSESAIKRAVDRTVQNSVRTIDREIQDVLAEGYLVEEAKSKQLDWLITLRANLTKSYYTSFVASGLSLAIPILAAVAPIVLKILGK